MRFQRDIPTKDPLDVKRCGQLDIFERVESAAKSGLIAIARSFITTYAVEPVATREGRHHKVAMAIADMATLRDALQALTWTAADIPRELKV